MASGHDLSDGVHGDRGDVRRIDFHADERAGVFDDAQPGLRSSAPFRIFFPYEAFGQFAVLPRFHRSLLDHAGVDQIAGDT